ncbi:glycosyltransferase [Salimicrobium halophilum]|uniref:Glycosyl transferases group 1 n=1 Tax=Salimicrobium halophilum TaxID=86666 RepID=A0A1G8UH90_9BACI|nr:glycosyltransferase [Salimicrobium halophilum]SDJ53131.1 Glycosyl transferases group 1 [Salimicrobium halophilum]
MNRKVKLLVFAGDFRNHLDTATHYFLSELEKLTDLTVWHESGEIHTILARLEKPPDFIYHHEFGEKYSPIVTGLKSSGIPYAVQLHDLHHRISKRKEMLREEKVKHIFTVYRDAFQHWYKNFRDHMYWLPHHVNSGVFKDYGLPKEYDYLVMGAMSRRTYPLRNTIVERMKDKPGFVHHQHPGYRNIEDGEKGAFVREAYAKEINKAKVFLTGNSKYNYPLKKNFEVLACNTLLLAPPSDELTDLGFIPGVHYVPINEEDFEEKAEYYVTHEKEREEIARNGMNMVRERHSTKRRVQEFVDIIDQIIAEEQGRRGSGP